MSAHPVPRAGQHTLTLWRQDAKLIGGIVRIPLAPPVTGTLVGAGLLRRLGTDVELNAVAQIWQAAVLIRSVASHLARDAVDASRVGELDAVVPGEAGVLVGKVGEVVAVGCGLRYNGDRF